MNYQIQITEIIPFLSLNSLEDKGDYYLSCCPFHSDKNPSFVIYKNSFHCQCFSCGENTHLYKLVKYLTGKDVYELLGVERDTSYKNYVFKRSLIKEKKESKLSKLSLRHIDIDFKGETYKPHNDSLVLGYLRKRNINDEIIQDWNIKYSNFLEINEKKYKNRLVIPIIENNKIINYALRDYTEKVPKKWKELYIKRGTSNTLFNIDNLDRNKTLYVVEGIMDLPLIYRHISKNCTCVFGINITDRQISLLKEFTDIVVIPDKDEAGEKMLSILDKKFEDKEFWIASLYTSEDAGASNKTELEEIINNKVLASKYFLEKYEILYKEKSLEW